MSKMDRIMETLNTGMVQLNSYFERWTLDIRRIKHRDSENEMYERETQIT